MLRSCWFSFSSSRRLGRLRRVGSVGTTSATIGSGIETSLQLWLDLLLATAHGVTHLTTVATFDLGPVLGLGAVAPGVTLGLANSRVSGRKRIWIGNIPVGALDNITLLGHVVLRTAVAAGALLTVWSVLGEVVHRLANLASTRSTGLLALLGTVANTMTLLAAELAGDSDAFDLHDVLRTRTLGMADLVAEEC